MVTNTCKQLYDTDPIVASLMKKLRHREEKYLIQDYTAIKGQG